MDGSNVNLLIFEELNGEQQKLDEHPLYNRVFVDYIL